MRPKVIAIIVLVVLALIVLYQNSDVVTIRLFFWSFAMSQVVLVLLNLAIGFVLGLFAATLPKKRE
jgi:uncharacterized integral membrane protein